MTIDPVIVLTEELYTAEKALQAACKLNNGDQGAYGEVVTRLLTKIRGLYGELFATPPTSAMGAGELVRMAAQHIPFSHARFSAHMHEIADRLCAAERLQTDLIWLRSMATALENDMCGESGLKAAKLMRLALEGAARPVVIYRATEPPSSVH